MGSVATDDRTLIEAFRAGDRAAFELLIRRHQKVVWAVAKRFTRDSAEAEDLAQRTFIAALEHIGELRGAFRPWLLHIAANLSRNHLRATRRLVSIEVALPGVPLRAVETNPDESLDGARLSRRLRSAIASLSARQREVVLLRIDGDLSFVEIAQVLGITGNNARVTYHTALKVLRQRLVPVADPSSTQEREEHWVDALSRSLALLPA